MSFTAGNNPGDPMLKSGPEQEKALFEHFNRASVGFDYNHVAGAAINLIANTVRQSCETRQQAEKMFDELSGRAKNLLLEQHYDPVSNRRRNIFPFTQHVQAMHVKGDDKF